MRLNLTGVALKRLREREMHSDVEDDATEATRAYGNSFYKTRHSRN